MNSFLANLNNNEKEKLETIFEIKSIKKGTIIMQEGQIGDSAFFLLEGKVSVIKETMYGEDYVVTTISSQGDEFFGEINLIDKGKRTSTIKALENCVIFETNSQKLEKFMNENTVIGFKIMKYMAQSLAKHLRKADNDVLTLFNALVEVVEND